MLDLTTTMIHDLGMTTLATQTMQDEGEDYNRQTVGFDFPNMCIYKIVGEVYNLGNILKKVGFYYDYLKDEWRTTNPNWYADIQRVADEGDLATIKQLITAKEYI